MDDAGLEDGGNLSTGRKIKMSVTITDVGLFIAG